MENVMLYLVAAAIVGVAVAVLYSYGIQSRRLSQPKPEATEFVKEAKWLLQDMAAWQRESTRALQELVTVQKETNRLLEQLLAAEKSLSDKPRSLN